MKTLRNVKKGLFVPARTSQVFRRYHQNQFERHDCQGFQAEKEKALTLFRVQAS